MIISPLYIFDGGYVAVHYESRSFTLSLAMLQDFDTLVAGGPGSKPIKLLLSGPPVQQGATINIPAELDAQGLNDANYASIYKMLNIERPPQVRTERFGARTFSTKPRLDWNLLINVLLPLPVEKRDKAMAEARKQGKLNRREMRKYETKVRRLMRTDAPLTVSASRVANALLVIGMTELRNRIAIQEGLTTSESARSETGDVPQTRAERTNDSARKTVEARTIRRGSRTGSMAGVGGI
jgi:hypothetical protein